jgi:RNA recognition motif-containing protein
MKIALPSNQNQIDEHFGHCEYFTVFTVDDQKLREVFRLAGRIVNAEVTKNREGRSRGFGIVDYSHPVEAVQAISMFNNQRVKAYGISRD